jgi:ribonuclease HI
VVVCDPAGRLVKEARRHIGHNTNQVAEYEALIRALEEALKAGARRLRVLTDSQFVVKQFTGEYKIRDARMQALMGRVRALQGKFDSVELQHIARSSHPHNKRADELANEALDELD